MAGVPDGRLDTTTRTAWADLCAKHAPALAHVDSQACLVHADLNPKNILVTRANDEWRVDAILDWEFSFSGCPYADAANMTRFATDHPADFVTGFQSAFADQVTAADDWLYVGRVMDMFALSDLVTRPAGSPIADRAAQEIHRWLKNGIPHSQ